MQKLTEVSETALITLRSRVMEARKSSPVLEDPVGEECFEALMALAPDELRKRVMERKLSPVLSMHIALRARKYDNLCREFLEEYPDGLIVSLGCGFDTRFWRLGGGAVRYLELDLPGVIRTKQEVLKDRITYGMMEDSVLEEEWILKVKKIQAGKVLFIAEGLFMYLPKDKTIQTLTRLADTFTSSRLIMEVVAEKYTQGWRKKMVEHKIRKGAGSTAGDYYQYGIREGAVLESYHPGFKLREEWTFFEDPDLKPAILRSFRHIKSLSKTQYTVIADIA
jgi:O-methyltransferase involved in polyketide biosynthesis